MTELKGTEPLLYDPIINAFIASIVKLDSEKKFQLPEWLDFADAV